MSIKDDCILKISEYPELPDISEYEKMIDWDDIPDTEDFSEGEKHFYNSSDNIVL